MDGYQRQANSPFLHCCRNIHGCCRNQFRKPYKKMRWNHLERKLSDQHKMTLVALSTFDFS